MDEQAKAELLSYLKETAEKVTDFAQHQGPLLAQEIVNWQFYSGIAWALSTTVGCLVIAGAGACLAHTAMRRDPEARKDSSQAAVVLGLLGILIATIAMTAIVPANVISAVKAKTCPRMAVIDYIASHK